MSVSKNGKHHVKTKNELVNRQSAKQKHAFPGNLGRASKQRVFIFCANSYDARAHKFVSGFRSCDRGDRNVIVLTVSLSKIHLINIKKCGKGL